jgi:hypothetical protein
VIEVVVRAIQKEIVGKRSADVVPAVVDSSSRGVEIGSVQLAVDVPSATGKKKKGGKVDERWFHPCPNARKSTSYLLRERTPLALLALSPLLRRAGALRLGSGVGGVLLVSEDR